MKALNREIAEAVSALYPGGAPPLVFGEGDPHARIMLIGEAPGAQEALAGRPFVGKAGKNLDAFLAETGFARAELYITNTVKLRPVRVSAAGRTVNRPPTREEVALFLPFLRREIALVDPACVVTMGNTALQALLGRGAVIGDKHGRFLRMDDQRPLFPIYHPASLIYNPALADVYARDLRVLADWRAAQL